MSHIPKYEYTYESHFRKYTNGDQELDDIFAKFRGKFFVMHPEYKNLPRTPTMFECFKYLAGRTNDIYVCDYVLMILEVCNSIPELKEKYRDRLEPFVKLFAGKEIKHRFKSFCFGNKF